MDKIFKMTFYILLQLFWSTNASPAYAKRSDWWENAIIYEIYPRSYFDSNGDGVGDLNGITYKLEYLRELGVTATVLTPIFQLDSDTSNFTVIDSTIGSMVDFQRLIQEAKRLDIKILMDLPPSALLQCKSKWLEKFGDRFQGSRNFYNNKYENNQHQDNRQSVSKDNAWTCHELRKHYNLQQHTQLSSCFSSKVQKETQDVLLFWLDKGADGFRVDVSNYFSESSSMYNSPSVYDMLLQLRNLLKDYTRKMGGSTRVLTTVAHTTIKQQMYLYENVDAEEISHFTYNHLLMSDLNKEKDARDFVYTIQQWITYMPHGHVPNWMIGCHEHSRVATRFNPEFIDAMNMLILTLPGVAVTYYGEEIGMEDKWESVDSLEKRKNAMHTPFQWSANRNAGFSKAKKLWLSIHPNYLKINLKQQTKTTRSHFKVYSSIAALRKYPALRSGHLHMAVLNNDVFAFKREVPYASPVLVVVINVSNKKQIVDLYLLSKLPRVLEVVVAGSTSKYEHGDVIDTRNLTLQNFECLLLQGNFTISAERRALIRTLIKSANIVLVGLLMYKLWHNKWTKLSFSKEALFQQ